MWLVQRTLKAYALPPEEAWETVSRHRVERRAVDRAKYWRGLARSLVILDGVVTSQRGVHSFHVRLVSPGGVITDYC